MGVNRSNQAESNSSNPQAYRLIEESFGFSFTTEQGTAYSIYFTDASGYIPDTSLVDSIYMVGFVADPPPAKGTKGGGIDPKIKNTIQKALLETFHANPEWVLVFVCDQSDGMFQGRNTLFHSWYMEHKQTFVKQDYTDGKTFYSSAIYKRENERRAEVESELGFFILYKEGLQA